jgi:NAD+ diphosphatase
MKILPPPAFATNALDRADHLRTDPEILGMHMRSETSKCLLFASGEVLGDETGDIEWVSPSSLRFLPVHETIFLGLEGDEMRYAASLNGTPHEFDDMFEDAKFRDVRATAMKLTSMVDGASHPSLGIIAQAKSMLSWHESHGFCAKCGSKTETIKAGYERKCPECDTSHFPRTDPVVIMLITDGDRILMGRGPHFPPNFFSALAGFMEPGETVEAAVARETHEEASISVENVRYINSQPWPWPSSLMIGCIADATTTDIKINDGELEDVRWFERREILEARSGEATDLMLPPNIAIARSLIEHWLAETV